MRATPLIERNKITHECVITGPWQEAFLRTPQSGDLKKLYGVRFPQIDSYQLDMSDLPASIAVIPLLTNILPIAWCYGATVHVEEVDQDFFEAQIALRRAFQAYNPQLALSGGLTADRQIVNRISEPKSPPLVLFSGGVDATFSLWGNLALRPQLVTVRGADVYFTEQEDDAWNVICKRHSEIAESIGGKFHTIESSFKTWLAYWKLNPFSKQAKGWNWWFNQQQGPALLGLCAPLAWKLQAKRIIVSSSFSHKDRIHTICGSNPSVDESVRYFGATTQHYDFTVTRQEKVAFLCEQAKLRNTTIPLRVCWKERSGHNCCKCEKCLRTIFAIYAENGDPQAFDFPATSEELIANINDPSFQMGVFWIGVLERLQQAETKDLPEVQAALRKGAASRFAPA